MSFRVGFTALAVLAASLASGPGASAQSASQDPTSGAVHEVIVELAPGATVDDLVAAPADPSTGVAELQLAPSSGGDAGGAPVDAVIDNVGTDGDWVSLDVDDEGLAALEASDLVAGVSPNHEISLALDQSVPAVGAATTPALGFDGSGTTVVIVDTGVDTDHDALEGSLVAEACFESIDLTCVGGTASSTTPGSGAACDLAVTAECGHGTHVAGIVAGRGAPRGVAPGAGIVSVRIFRPETDGAWARTEDLILAMEWVRDNHAAWGTVSVNLSLGFVVSPFSGTCDFFGGPLQSVMADLRAAGVATVVASGNADGGPTYANAVYPPACFSAATPVSATYTSGGIAAFAHRSEVVDLVAPGATSPSAGISSAAAGTDTGTASLFGTSMAAPHVAGMFALLREAEPSLSVAQVEGRLRDSGLPVADPFIDRSYSLVRADRALCNVPRRVGCAQAWAGDGSATVEWRNLAAPDHGIVEYRVTLDDGSPPVVLPSTAATHTATGLTNGDRYGFLVEALGPGQAVLASATSNDVVPKPPPGPHGFVDVSDGAFYAPGVRWARSEGVTTGLGGTSAFAPAATVSRAEMVTLLWRMADQPTGHPPHGFPDVPPGVYYEEAVAWARANGITTGVGGTGRFKPDLPVSRGELVTFLWRFVGGPGGYLPDDFVDTASGAFYDPAVRWATFHGITTGVGGSATFAPSGAVSRGEAVTFLRRAAADPAAWDQGALVPSTVVF